MEEAIKCIRGAIYEKLIRYFVELCVGEFKDCIDSIILYGSLARGEFIPNISDIDILVIFNDKCWKGEVKDETYPIPSWIVSILMTLLNEIHERFNLERHIIDLTVTTMNIMKNKMDPKFNVFWLNNVKKGYYVLYGADVLKDYVPPPITKADVKRALQELLRTAKLVAEARRIGERELTLHDKAKACITNALMAIQVFLCLYEDFIPSKARACKEFQRKFPQSLEASIVCELYEALLELDKLTQEHLKSLIIKSLTLIKLFLERSEIMS